MRWAVLVLVGACMADEAVDVETTTTEQASWARQGWTMQGWTMQGWTMQGWTMQGFQLGGATLSDSALENLRVERGELVAERNGVTLRGTELAGVELVATITNASGQQSTVPFRIRTIERETGYDPTGTGNTYLYTIEQRVEETHSWANVCPADADGRAVAIPFRSIWNATGDRIESPDLFTLACTSGVIAKCYRWGYKPWLTGYGDANFDDLHQTCTRLARADYCGNGVPHTRNGTAINVWDRLPAPGPIQRRGFYGMLFEAGWNTDGAVCLSHARWLLGDGLELHALCPERLIPPALLGATVCDTVTAALSQDSDAMLFNESYLNLF